MISPELELSDDDVKAEFRRRVYHIRRTRKKDDYDPRIVVIEDGVTIEIIYDTGNHTAVYLVVNSGKVMVFSEPHKGGQITATGRSPLTQPMWSMEPIRYCVLPVLRKTMVLDDLARA